MLLVVSPSLYRKMLGWYLKTDPKRRRLNREFGDRGGDALCVQSEPKSLCTYTSKDENPHC